MSSVEFKTSDSTALHNSTAYVTESNLHWAVLDNSNAASVTAVTDAGSNLNISSGIGTITTSAGTGSKIIIVQSPTTAAIGAYVMTVT
jgi:hypothetical protein